MAACTRSALAVATALAVAGLPLLPPEHVHRAGIEGRATALVHAHEDVSDDGGASSARGTALHGSHGSHGLAIFLSTQYDTAVRFAPLPPALVTARVTAPPSAHFIGFTVQVTSHAIHGPPGPSWLTRGPPSLS
jgi:hypothetical protein